MEEGCIDSHTSLSLQEEGQLTCRPEAVSSVSVIKSERMSIDVEVSVSVNSPSHVPSQHTV